MNSLDFFEHFYKKNREKTFSKSLLSFFNEFVRPRLTVNNPKVLDLGSGSYSLFEEVSNLNANIIALDFSKEAIHSAPKSQIIYKEGSVTDRSFFPESTLDLIFDSHCLNCITNDTDRDQTYQNIFHGLKTGGLFASELMVQPVGQHVSMPFKKIKTTLELEQEIISHGFKILYFSIARDFEFRSEVDGLEIKCDVLKIICQK